MGAGGPASNRFEQHMTPFYHTSLPVRRSAAPPFPALPDVLRRAGTGTGAGHRPATGRTS